MVAAGRECQFNDRAEGEVEILKSHYERVSRGKMDFRKVPRVYYLTDTFYMPRLAVQTRQPGAVLLKSFPKPEGT